MPLMTPLPFQAAPLRPTTTGATEGIGWFADLYWTRGPQEEPRCLAAPLTLLVPISPAPIPLERALGNPACTQKVRTALGPTGTPLCLQCGDMVAFRLHILGNSQPGCTPLSGATPWECPHCGHSQNATQWAQPSAHLRVGLVHRFLHAAARAWGGPVGGAA